MAGISSIWATPRSPGLKMVGLKRCMLGLGCFVGLVFMVLACVSYRT